mmetsp:Transcript_6744/g.15652  ORF Transcript_6744/g.15652 Transcript_6744/m.15652 type:complete len:214 (+) Transcript_6744:727-1368(+)
MPPQRWGRLAPPHFGILQVCVLASSLCGAFSRNTCCKRFRRTGNISHRQYLPDTARTWLHCRQWAKSARLVEEKWALAKALLQDFAHTSHVTVVSIAGRCPEPVQRGTCLQRTLADPAHAAMNPEYAVLVAHTPGFARLLESRLVLQKHRMDILQLSTLKSQALVARTTSISDDCKPGPVKLPASEVRILYKLHLQNQPWPPPYMARQIKLLP